MTKPTRRELIRNVGAALTVLPAAQPSQDAARAEPSALRLWYRSPAKEWTEALPVGNGNLGAMVFGGVQRERLQLNEHSLWSGHRSEEDNPQSLEYLPKVRQLLFEGRYAEANKMAAQYLMARPPRPSAPTQGAPGASAPAQRPTRASASYQTLGDLLLEFHHGAAAPEDYTRELNLDTGIARVEYRAGGARFTRETFASHPDQAIIVRLACDKPGGLALAARLEREADAQVEYLAPNRIRMHGKADNGGVDFECQVVVRAEGGRTCRASCSRPARTRPSAARLRAE